MLSRIILLVLVLLVIAFREQIKTIIGAGLVSALVGGLGGVFVNWIINGDLLCWGACKTGIYVGLIVAGAIIVLSWLISLVRRFC